MNNKNKIIYTALFLLIAILLGKNYQAIANEIALVKKPKSFASNIPTNKIHSLANPYYSPAVTLSNTTLFNNTNCQIIYAQPNHRYFITSSINFGTHMIFPENSVDVVVGSKELWDQAHSMNHVFIKPNSNEKEGEATTLTFISESNNSYDFIVQRVPYEKVNTCVVIKRNNSLLNETTWNNFSMKNERMKNFFAMQLAEQKKQMADQQRSAMEKYRANIYTNYTWPRKAGLLGHAYISDVYDDRRWTYVRVAQDSVPIMAIYGVLNGKKNLLEFTYDAITREYRVPGIYDGITIAYNGMKIPIKRLS